MITVKALPVLAGGCTSFNAALKLLFCSLGVRRRASRQTSVRRKPWQRRWIKEWQMNKRTKVSELPEFDAAPYLDSEEAVAAYLTDILESGDPALLAAALGDIARARGMTEIAKASGIAREALYKALRSDSQPRFDTISRVCAALGVRLVAQPIHV
jgi:probable addiction module antidote protein